VERHPRAFRSGREDCREKNPCSEKGRKAEGGDAGEGDSSLQGGRACSKKVAEVLGKRFPQKSVKKKGRGKEERWGSTKGKKPAGKGQSVATLVGSGRGIRRCEKRSSAFVGKRNQAARGQEFFEGLIRSAKKNDEIGAN